MIRNIKVKGNNNQISLKGNINNFYIPNYYNIKQELTIQTENIFSSKVLKLIEEITKYESDFGIEDISDILNFDSVSQLTNEINSKDEPTKAFLDYFSEQLKISNNWLRYSRDYIFDYPSLHTLFVSDLYDLLIKENFEELYFITSENPNKEVLILIKYRKYIYRKCFRRIPFHSNVGSGGKSMIYDFYKFLIKWSKNKDLVNKTYEYMVPKDIFESILIGEIYPGCIRKESRVNYICEDFICLNCSKYEEEYYKKIYDDDFFICRDIVRKKLNEK